MKSATEQPGAVSPAFWHAWGGNETGQWTFALLGLNYGVGAGCWILCYVQGVRANARAPLAEEQLPAFWREARYVSSPQETFPVVLFSSLLVAALRCGRTGLSGMPRLRRGVSV